MNGNAYSLVTDTKEQELVDEALEEERPENVSVAETYTFDIKVLDANKEEIEIRELEDDAYAPDSEFKEELVPTAPTALPEEGLAEDAAAEDFDFDALELGDDDLMLDDDF